MSRRKKWRRTFGYWQAVFLTAALSLIITFILYIATPRSTHVHLKEFGDTLGSQEEYNKLQDQPTPEYCARQGAPPLVCAHGGETSAAPPNTAKAFRAALNAGIRCVEVDLARTVDGELVVLHSRELAHLLSLGGGEDLLSIWQEAAAASGKHEQAMPQPQAGNFTWEQLQVLRWEGGETLERVEDILAMVLHSVDHVTLDIKPFSQNGENLDGDMLIQQLATLVGRMPCGGRCLLWAKSDALVVTIKQLTPSLPVGYVVMNETLEARSLGLDRLLRLDQAEVVAMHHAMASHSLVQMARDAGKKVHAWTANTAEMMQRVLEVGVDAVVTNHPLRLLAAIESRAAVCRRKRSTL